MNRIEYRNGNDLALAEVIALYRDSTLGERRPIDDERIVADMLSKVGFRNHESAWVLRKGDSLVERLRGRGEKDAG